MDITVTATIAKRFTPILALLLLSACGGGGSTSSPTVITVPTFTTAPTPSPPPPPPLPPPVDLIATPAGTSCVTERDPDVFGVAFDTVNTVQSQSHGCIIVNSTDKQPVFDGLRSARFEVRPEDCGASVSFNDCTNDRSRHEISEKEGASTSGQVITWEENIYIPKQTRFRPKGNGNNALFITQINFKNKADYGTIAYLEIGQNGELIVSTHIDFTWIVKKKHIIANSFPVDTWTNIKFEVLSTAQSNGYIRVYLNGKLVVEENRPTLPTAEHSNMMRFGIYNAFKSLATEPYTTQVIYFDGVKKSVRLN
jgi:hypothetical protein